MLRLSRKNCLRAAAILVPVFAATPAFAHPGHALATTLAVGFLHPFTGLDHLLAMLAVGIWAVQSKRPAIWLLPIMFPLLMAFGAGLGLAYGAFSGLESGIAVTVASLGLFIAFRVKMPVPAGVAVISLFAALHGYSHGIELPHGSSVVSYGAGFIVATVLLHLLGMSIALIGGKKSASRAIRIGGAAIAGAGLYFLAIA